MPQKECNLTIVPDPSLSGVGVYVKLVEARLKIQKKGGPIVFSQRSHVAVSVDGGEETVRDLLVSNTFMHDEHEPEYRGEREVKVHITSADGLFSEYVVIEYNTETDTCGGPLVGQSGTIRHPNLNGEFDCEWSVRNTRGNTVQINLHALTLPLSNNCTDSYLEIRRDNSSGEVVGRWCKYEWNAPSITGESFFIRLRHRPEEVDEDLAGSEPVQPKMHLYWVKSFGGVTTSPVIESPEPGITSVNSVIWTVVANSSQAVLIHFDSLQIPEVPPSIGFMPYGLYFTGADDSLSQVPWNSLHTDAATHRVAGWVAPRDLYLDYSRVLIRYYAPARSSFRLSWQSVPKRNANTTFVEEDDTKNATKKVYSCGGALVPSITPRRLTYPMQLDGYKDNEHCKWTIERPLFHGLSVRIVSMDLEYHMRCMLDYIAFVAERGISEDAGDNLSGAMRLCTSNNRTYEFSYNKVLNIHFVSDRSRNGKGFVLEYWLNCNSFDFIKSSHGLLDHELTSLGWPAATNETNCMWTVVLETNRRLAVRLTGLDLDTTRDCAKDAVIVSPRPTHFSSSGEHRYCGTMETQQDKKEVEYANGRVFIRMQRDKESNGKGFSLRLRELVTDCSSSELFVDESEPNKVITSPLFPKMSPNSLDCEWTIRAPPGKRLQFTVDPHTFELQDSGNDEDECKDDYLEIRDGPTEHAPVVGRYCRHQSPSTITSTGNYLFVRYITDYNAMSAGWNATYEIASCGGTLILPPNGTLSLQSPNFPEPPLPLMDCEWTIKAPNAHFVEADLTHLAFQYHANCSLQSMTVRDGVGENATLLLPQSCSGRSIVPKHFRSSSPVMTVQMTTNSTSNKAGRMFCFQKKCGFEMEFKTSAIACGGIISDAEGFLTTPGFPGRLLPHVQCEWQLRAGVGNRYKLELEWTDKEGFYQQRFGYGGLSKGECYGDLDVFNGGSKYMSANYMNDRYFCENSTTFVSTADVVTVKYSDIATRDHRRYVDLVSTTDEFYHPFRVRYTKVSHEYDEEGCSHLITSNSSQKFVGINMTDSEMTKAYYCHVHIKRPTVTGTTRILIRDFNSLAAIAYHHCTDFASFIDITSIDDLPQAIEQRICNVTFARNGKRSLDLAFLNQELDMNIFAHLTGGDLKFGNLAFQLHVQFHDCGAYITHPHSGVVTSPGWDGDKGEYVNNARCKWLLEAPEGHVVKFRITDMEIEHDPSCSRDVLRVGEGKAASTIHRYCYDPRNTTAEPLPARFATVQSQSRWLSLYWTTDLSTTGKGWRIEYEFVPSGSVCGFSSSDMAGEITTPGFVKGKDYDNDLMCVWDVSVPMGYHVRLDFVSFDVAASEECAEDSLLISQEHQARAWAPVGGYYFLFDQEEVHSPYCGINTPAPFHSESNRIRLNFTTNEKTNARGFKLRWSAECGTVYRLSHGVLTSPHYPEMYPNTNSECEYLIDPETEGEKIVVIKMLDFDLSPAISDYDRRPCNTDYVQIRDVIRKRVVQTICADQKNEEFQPLAIKGAVGITFVSNRSYVHSEGRKLNRGFKISYALSKCGGDIALSEEHGLAQYISSPAFPLPYPHDLDCVWNVTAPEGRVISVKFEKMELEYHADCSMDYLEMFDGAEITNTTRSLGKWCGDRAPASRLSSSDSALQIRFSSDRSMNKGGFQVVVTATPGPKSGCGGNLAATGDWKTLEPPKDANGYYLDHLRCGWNIKGAENTVLELVVSALDTEPLVQLPGKKGGKQCVDSLSIYDGYRSFSPLIASDLCSDPDVLLPLTYHTSHKVAHVYFDSDAGGSGAGFTLKYRAIAADCGGRLTANGEKQIIDYESKSVALSGQTHQRCQYVIVAKEQEPIWLHFTQFNFPSASGDCSDSYVEIRDAGLTAQCQHPACATENHEKKVVHLCGDRVPPVFVSNTLAVQITTSAFISSNDTARLMFEYQLLDGCNRTVDASSYASGHLTSPNFPKPYSMNQTCSTSVQAAEGDVILFVWRILQLERGRPNIRGGMRTYEMMTRKRTPLNYTCEYDWVQINEPSRNDSKKYCSTQLPPTLLTQANIAEVFFKSDTSMATQGYDVSYFTGKPRTGGSEIAFARSFDLNGAIAQPGWPFGYRLHSKYSWELAPPVGHGCLIEVVAVEAGRKVVGRGCSDKDDYLEIAVTSNSQTRSQRFNSCEGEQGGPVKMPVEPSVDRLISVVFESDGQADNDGRGFHIQWTCADLEPPRD